MLFFWFAIWILCCYAKIPPKKRIDSFFINPPFLNQDTFIQKIDNESVNYLFLTAKVWHKTLSCTIHSLKASPSIKNLDKEKSEHLYQGAVSYFCPGRSRHKHKKRRAFILFLFNIFPHILSNTLSDSGTWLVRPNGYF